MEEEEEEEEGEEEEEEEEENQEEEEEEEEEEEKDVFNLVVKKGKNFFEKREISFEVENGKNRQMMDRLRKWDPGRETDRFCF